MILKIVLLLTFSIYSSSVYSEFHFHQTEETLKRIEEIINNKDKGMYLRFGDGDLNLAYGEVDLYQKPNEHLQKEMREAFSLNGPTILKSLPLYCREFNGYEEGMFPGNHECPYSLSIQFLEKAKTLWGEEITDVYSHAALAFAATHKTELALHFLQFLRKNPCSILIGNENIPAHIRTLLFESNCKFIQTPSQNSYQSMDQIEKECLNLISSDREYKVIVLAMGCSGRVLQKRLWNKASNVFLFDFGSLMDALCGWNTRAWIDLTNFDYERFLTDLSKEK